MLTGGSGKAGANTPFGFRFVSTTLLAAWNH